MENHEREKREYYTIDTTLILKQLWRKAWLIILVVIIAGSIGFSCAKFYIDPTYSSSVLLYVNNNAINLGSTSFSISSSQISAAQSLVNTYIEILNNRTTLEKVAEKTDLGYTAHDLSGMIESEPSNETEIMKITVTSKDPYHSAEIANCIAEVLPQRIAEIIDGASMEVVDSAVPRLQKVAPSITKYTAVAMVLGGIFIVIVIGVATIMDDTIHDEEYILQSYNYPILAKIPNLLHSGSSKYSYYYSQKSSNRK